MPESGIYPRKSRRFNEQSMELTMADERMVANLADMMGMLRILQVRAGDRDLAPDESLRILDETRALAVRMTASLRLSIEDFDLLRKAFSAIQSNQAAIALLQLQSILETHCRLAHETYIREQAR